MQKQGETKRSLEGLLLVTIQATIQVGRNKIRKTVDFVRHINFALHLLFEVNIQVSTLKIAKGKKK